MNNWNRFSVIVLICVLFAEAVAMYHVIMLKMLPMEVVILLMAGTALFTVFLCFLLFRRKQRTGHGKQVAGYLLSLTLIVGALAGTNVVVKLNHTLGAVTNDIPESTTGVYVMQDNSAMTIEEAADYTFGYTSSYDLENSLASLQELQTMFGAHVSVKEFISVFHVVDALYQGNVDAMLLNPGYISVLEELPAYVNFSQDTRMIYEYIGRNADEQAVKEEVVPDDPTKQAFIVYLSGTDSRSSKIGKSRSDVNILAVVNPQTKQILLVNTPRDYYISNPAGNGAKDKLTHCGLYGARCSADALSELYGYPVAYYAQINFSGFKKLIDAFDGVTVYSDVAFTTRDGYYIKEGENRLNGARALSFARERKALQGGDNTRGQNQMKIIAGLVNELSAGSVIANYSEIMDSLQGMFVTDMPTETIAKLIKMQISDMAKWEISTCAVTGTSGSEYTYSASGVRAYVMHPDVASVQEAAKQIGAVMEGTK